MDIGEVDSVLFQAMLPILSHLLYFFRCYSKTNRSLSCSFFGLPSISATTDSEVIIDWEGVENATSYCIYYKESGAKNWVKIATVGSNTQFYIHESSSAYPLKASCKYLYTIRAYNSASKKWGGYNTKGWSVTTPEDPDATPMPQPTKKPQPTEAPKPSPKPTSTPKPTPTATDGTGERLSYRFFRPCSSENQPLRWRSLRRNPSE